MEHLKDRLWRSGGVFLRRFFLTLGILTAAVFVLLVTLLGRLGDDTVSSLPEKTILTYTFKSGLMETVSSPALTQRLFHQNETFHEIIDSLTRAEKDDRVKGFVARLQGMDMSLAQIQGLRDALALFRAANKFSYVFADDIGGFSSGMADYYLAASFNQIWLQPVGIVSINGIAAEVPFAKNLLDELGVEAQFGHRGRYKSAPESLTNAEMSEPHREMMAALTGDLSGQIVSDIAADRGLTGDALKTIINNAPYTDKEALALKLIEKTGYYDDLIKAAKHEAGGEDAETVELLKYRSGMKNDFLKNMSTQKRKKIALIFGNGNIVPYSSQSHAGLTGGDMQADKIVKAFRAAQDDQDVAAVVFRIDSPGGSPGAAESIRRAVTETQAGGKPVIVSMGGYAASGGYWIATPANKIVAEPATITGSIGVFGGKFVLAKLWEKIGVHWERIGAGENAGMWSPNTPFSEKEFARFEFMLDNIYDAFIDRVAEGRKMTREQVMAVAEGRVWTGRQAKEKGLVDELGGMDKAVELAKQAAGLPPQQEITLEEFPARQSPIEMLIDLATEGVAVMPVVNIDARTLLNAVVKSFDAESEVLRIRKPF